MSTIDLKKLFVYDEETYPNVFTFGIVRGDGKWDKVFEISEFQNDFEDLIKCLNYLETNDFILVGFNNINFDYPILHKIISMKDSLRGKSGKVIAKKIYSWAQEQIDTMRDGFASTVPENEHYIPQIDLFKINHFDNKAKMTSLKQIEFNMRLANVQDLPFTVGTTLTKDEIVVLKKYNAHDVEATRMFLTECVAMLQLREDLSKKYNLSLRNASDSKIGGEFFLAKLKEAGVSTHHYKNGKLTMKQSPRKVIDLGECLFDYYEFTRPEFIAVKNWFSQQKITETKGVFSDIPEHRLGDVAKYANMVVKKKKIESEVAPQELLKEFPLGYVETVELSATEIVKDENGEKVFEMVEQPNGKMKKVYVKRNKKSYYFCYRIATSLNVVIDGLEYVFGVGGIHASRQGVVKATDEKCIRDGDVSSLYPNLGISNNVYPEHLGFEFCGIYQNVYEERKKYPKGTMENLAIKLALNATYGNSNNKFSFLYDPKYTMTITINGQLSICMWLDMLMQKLNGTEVVSLNTDGLVIRYLRSEDHIYEAVCKEWENKVKLQLEFADYSAMYIRDVNNYIAVYENGKTKNKGAYEYKDLPHHKDQSMLVVPKAAEAAMVKGQSIEEFIMSHSDKWDFMKRCKVPKSSKLIAYNEIDEVQLPNVTRYYVSKNGMSFKKVMPPTEGKEEDRDLSIEAGWLCKEANLIENIDNINDIDYSYYIAEANKLLIVDEIEFN